MSARATLAADQPPFASEVSMSPSLNSPTPIFALGKPFDPCRERCGFYAPDIVARQRALKDGPKRLYERLVRWAGKNGECWYGVETIANALGKSERQVRYDINTLERLKLIDHRWRDGRRSNTYVFLFHHWFERQSTAAQIESATAESERQPAAGRTNLSGSPLPTNRVRNELCKEKPLQSNTRSDGDSASTLRQTHSTQNRSPAERTNQEGVTCTSIEYDQSDIENLKTAIEMFTYADGTTVDATPILPSLLKKLKFFKATPLQMSHVFYRVWNSLKTRPSLAPMKPAWFSQVAENHFRTKQETASEHARERRDDSRPSHPYLDGESDTREEKSGIGMAPVSVGEIMRLLPALRSVGAA
jgi:hypothetical protein